MSKIRIEKLLYKNGEPECEVPYQNNKQHGLLKYWYYTKQLRYEIPYQNNKLHGIERWWYGNRQIKNETYWLYGKEITKEEYRKHILIESLACLK